MAKSGKAGTGDTTPFNGGDIGADTVPTRPSDQQEDREGFTVKRTVTPCGVPDYQKNKTGLAGNGGYDCLPGEENK